MGPQPAAAGHYRQQGSRSGKGAEQIVVHWTDCFVVLPKKQQVCEKGYCIAKALERELFQYILQLDETEKKSVLQMLKAFARDHKRKTAHISIAQYNKEIDEVIARVEAGEFSTHEDAVTNFFITA